MEITTHKQKYSKVENEGVRFMSVSEQQFLITKFK